MSLFTWVLLVAVLAAAVLPIAATADGGDPQPKPPHVFGRLTTSNGSGCKTLQSSRRFGLLRPAQPKGATCYASSRGPC
jgi:hypothetical protein